MTSRFIRRVVDLDAAADVFLIDQFGTLHDGVSPYPGAVHALESLRWKNKRIVLLSNSGRRAAANAKRMKQIGFSQELFDVCITSGEVAWHALRADPPDYLRRRSRVLLLARDQSLDVLEGFDVTLADDAKDADFVLIAGSEADKVSYERLWQRLQSAIDRGIPAICTNPDFEMIVDGRLYPGAGHMAKRYYERGGKVRFFGKPYPAVYDTVFAALPGVPKNRMIGIGDSLQHDICGAGAAGCQSLLVLNGILSQKSSSQVTQEIASQPHRPDYIMTSFR